MNGKEFIKRVKKAGKSRGVEVHTETTRGKGSHQTLYYGTRRTTVKHSEIGPGLLKAMCKQLGINPRDL